MSDGWMRMKFEGGAERRSRLGGGGGFKWSPHSIAGRTDNLRNATTIAKVPETGISWLVEVAGREGRQVREAEGRRNRWSP